MNRKYIEKDVHFKSFRVKKVVRGGKECHDAGTIYEKEKMGDGRGAFTFSIR